MKLRSSFFLLAIPTVAGFVFLSIPGKIRAQTSQARQLQQTAPVSSWPTKAKRWALVIGVDQYADPQNSAKRIALMIGNGAYTKAPLLKTHQTMCATWPRRCERWALT